MRWLALCALAAGTCEEDSAEVCLLSLRATAGRSAADTQAEQEKSEEGLETVSWASALLQARRVAAEQPSVDIDKFIRAQLAGADHCHAKLLEARRTLDGLEAQVTGLADAIASHNDIEKSNTKLLKDAIEEKAAAQEAWEEAIDACESTALDPSINQYKKEIEELENIANPKVRSEIAYGENAEDYGETAREYAKRVADEIANNQSMKDAIAHNLTEEHGITLLAGWSWGPSQCHAFAQLLQLKAGRNYTELSCNETRDNLQREFTEAYTALVDLYNKGVQQASDDLADCKRMADQEKALKLADIDNKIRDATTNIFQARGVLDDLMPVHQKLTRGVEAMQKHLLDLRQECAEEEGVSEHLERVRRLIRVLDSCPGRNDFTLDVPDLEIES